ncbi:MAG: CopG family transcriptional regulator, partial [Staphylothermus sp.]|nr:CopG family transcriptional regulator [Staphylothermus sp.]
MIKVDEETYNKLIELSEKEGFSVLNDYIVSLIKKAVGKEEYGIEWSKLKSKIERLVQDMVNQQLSVVETIRRQIMDLYDKIDDLSNQINELRKNITELQTTTTQYRRKKQETRTRKTGIERLREEKVVFESKLTGLSYKDKFFSYLERMGAIVIPLKGERVAIDLDFWEEFKRKLFNEIDTN